MILADDVSQVLVNMKDKVDQAFYYFQFFEILAKI